jgi:hypothetical protein
MKTKTLKRLLRLEIEVRREQLTAFVEAAEGRDARAAHTPDEASREKAQAVAVAEYEAFGQARKLLTELLELPELK